MKRDSRVNDAARKPGQPFGIQYFLMVVAVGLEQHRGAAMLADRLGGPLDHAVALAGLLIFDLAGSSDLEALFGARFGLHLGHLALLKRLTRAEARGRQALKAQGLTRVLGIERVSSPRQPFQPGNERAALWQRCCRLTTGGRGRRGAPRKFPGCRGGSAQTRRRRAETAEFHWFCRDLGAHSKVYEVAASASLVYIEFTHKIPRVRLPIYARRGSTIYE